MAVKRTVAELEEEFHRIRVAWQNSTDDRQLDLLQQLKSILEQSWEVAGNESLDLRRRVRTFIADAGHHVHDEAFKHPA